jgi:hypothetical protein
VINGKASAHKRGRPFRKIAPDFLLRRLVNAEQRAYLQL